MTFGEKVKVLRKSKNISQQELADMVGANSSTVISNWETGKNDPNIDSIRRLCASLDCSADYLIKTHEDSEVNTTPGERLKDALNRKKYKHKDFANDTKICYTTLSRYLNNKSSMPDDYIKRASEALELPEDYIKNGDTSCVDLPLFTSKEIQRNKKIEKQLDKIESMIITILQYLQVTKQ